MLGLGLALRADGRGASLGFSGEAVLLGGGHILNALLFDLSSFEHGGDELLFIAQNLGLLHLDLAFALHLLHLHLLGGHLLQHHVGLQFISLVGGGLLCGGSARCTRPS